jgi:hypothetical protein
MVLLGLEEGWSWGGGRWWVLEWVSCVSFLFLDCVSSSPQVSIAGFSLSSFYCGMGLHTASERRRFIGNSSLQETGIS